MLLFWETAKDGTWINTVFDKRETCSCGGYFVYILYIVVYVYICIARVIFSYSYLSYSWKSAINRKVFLWNFCSNMNLGSVAIPVCFFGSGSNFHFDSDPKPHPNPNWNGKLCVVQIIQIYTYIFLILIWYATWVITIGRLNQLYF